MIDKKFRRVDDWVFMIEAFQLFVKWAAAAAAANV